MSKFFPLILQQSPERGFHFPPRGFSFLETTTVHRSATAHGGSPLGHPGGNDCALSTVSCGNFKSPAREERLPEKSLPMAIAEDSETQTIFLIVRVRVS
jgi:hypothetical protein